MNIQTQLKVHNNVTTGFDSITATTTCVGTIDLHIPIDKDTMKVIEVDRIQIREFLARTSPHFTVQNEHYIAEDLRPI